MAFRNASWLVAKSGSSEKIRGHLSRRDFERLRDELLWLAEAILGNREEAEACLMEAILRIGIVYVPAPWRDIWIKRCVVLAAICKARSEIREIACVYPPYLCYSFLALPLNLAEKQILRSLSAEKITEGSNVLECAALILHGYLGFSIHDCAVSMECQRSLIEPACSSALKRLFEERTMAPMTGKVSSNLSESAA